jgi:hypothetical protein
MSSPNNNGERPRQTDRAKLTTKSRPRIRLIIIQLDIRIRHRFVFTSMSGRMYPVAISTGCCHGSCSRTIEPMSILEVLPRMASQLARTCRGVAQVEVETYIAYK